MESWLPTDTIRRAGFGQVVVGRRHVLTLERGVSVVGLGGDGRAAQVEYASGLLAPLPRFRVTMTSSDANKAAELPVPPVLRWSPFDSK
jgi:hypothetical protein